MSDCIIKTKDLSMDTVKAIYYTLKLRLSIEGKEITRWKYKEETTNEGLSKEAMDDLLLKKEALRREAKRLAESMRKK